MEFKTDVAIGESVRGSPSRRLAAPRTALPWFRTRLLYSARACCSTLRRRSQMILVPCSHRVALRLGHLSTRPRAFVICKQRPKKKYEMIGERAVIT